MDTGVTTINHIIHSLEVSDLEFIKLIRRNNFHRLKTDTSFRFMDHGQRQKIDRNTLLNVGFREFSEGPLGKVHRGRIATEEPFCIVQSQTVTNEINIPLSVLG